MLCIPFVGTKLNNEHFGVIYFNDLLCKLYKLLFMMGILYLANDNKIIMNFEHSYYIIIYIIDHNIILKH